MQQRPPTSQFSISFHKQQFKSLADAILVNYAKCFNGQKVPKPQNLQQAFFAIILNKNQQIRQLTQAYKLQLNKSIGLANQVNYEHISHEEQQQIDKMSPKHLKIFSRLIDLKNNKTQALLSLQKSYDSLLKQSKKLNQNNKELEIAGKVLKKQYEECLKQITKLQNQIKIKNDKQKHIITSVKALSQRFKFLISRQKQFQSFVYGSYSRMFDQFYNNTQKSLGQFSKYIRYLKQQYIKKRQEQFEIFVNKVQIEKTKTSSTIKFLVNQLSRFANFERKQAQTDQTWIQQYKAYTQTRDERQDPHQGQPQVYPKPRISKNQQFINKHKSLLGR